MAIPYEKVVKQDLELGFGTVSRTMPAGGTASGEKVGLHTFLEQAYNPMNFGAVGDGNTDDTEALQAAIDASPAIGGAVVLPATGTFKCGNLTVTNKTRFVMRSFGAKIVWRGAASATEYIGIQLVGTLTDVLFQDLILEGDAVLANRHAGIWNNSGQTITNIALRRNTIRNVVFGCGVGATSGGTVQSVEISGNYIDNVVGEDVGTGYGIYHASVQGSASQHVRIIGNVISRAGRHSIYQGGGNGVIIANNSIRLHRTGASVPGSARSAIVCSRTTDAIIIGNLIDTAQDGGIEVDAGADAASVPINAYNVAVIGNTISNGFGVRSGIVVGTNRPDLNGITSDILISGNRIRSSGVNAAQLWIDSGVRVDVIGNAFEMLACPGTASSLYIAGSLEAGTATYTDEIMVKDNAFYGTGGSYNPIEFGAAAAGSTITAHFISNRMRMPGNAFSFDATHTDPNVSVFDTPITGMVKAKIAPMSAFPLLLSVGTGIGAVLRFIEPAAIHTNWQMAFQENISDALEITPSDTAGGRVFTYPFVTMRNDGRMNVGSRSDASLDATLGVCDKTPATGITKVIVQAGAGQAGNVPLAVKDSGGGLLSSLGPAGQAFLKPVTFANLGGTPAAGTLQVISDSNTAVWGANIAGGGANMVLAFYNGANWTVVGK